MVSKYYLTIMRNSVLDKFLKTTTSIDVGMICDMPSETVMIPGVDDLSGVSV